MSGIRQWRTGQQVLLMFLLLPSAMSALSEEFTNALKASNPNIFNHPLYEDIISSLEGTESNETFYPAEETFYPEEETPTPYPSSLEERASELPQNVTSNRQVETPPTASPTAPSKSLKGAEHGLNNKKSDRSSVKRKGHKKKSKKKSKITRVPVTPSPTASASPTVTASPTVIASASPSAGSPHENNYGNGKRPHPSRKHDHYYHHCHHDPTSSPAPSGLFTDCGKGKGRPKKSKKKKKDEKRSAKSKKISEKSKLSKESRSSKSSKSNMSKICDSSAPSVSFSPTVAPEPTVSPLPTVRPTQTPTLQPGAPTGSPTTRPTGSPIRPPTGEPVVSPTEAPVVLPTEAPTIAPVGGELTEAPGTQAPTLQPGVTSMPTTAAPTTANATGTPTLANTTLAPDVTASPTPGGTTLAPGGETTDSPTISDTTAEPTIVINGSEGSPTAAPAGGGIPTRAFIVTYALTSTDAISPEDFAASEIETCLHLNSYLTNHWSMNPFIEFESLDCVAVSTRSDPAVQIDLLLETNFLQGGNMVTEEDLILLYYAALSPPGSAPLIVALQTLEPTNPFSTTTAVTVELPAELRGIFSSTNTSGEGTFSSDAVSSSSNPLLVAMAAVSCIMLFSFAGVFVVRKRNNRQLRATYMAGKQNDFCILEDGLEDETGSSTLSFHDFEQQPQQDETTAILFAPIDAANREKGSRPHQSPLFRKSMTEI